MATSRLRRASAAVALLGASTAAVAFTAAAPASAGTTIHVDVTGDDGGVNGNCSLREAIDAANTDRRVDTCPAGNGTDTIVLDADIYAVRLGPIEVRSTVFVRGVSADATAIDGQLIDTSRYWRVFHVNAGAALDVSKLTFQRSALAVRNDGTLHLTSTVVRDGATTVNPDGANAVVNHGRATLKDITIDDVPFSMMNGPKGTLNVDGLTMTKNGGADCCASVTNSGSMSLNNATFAGDVSKCCNDDTITNLPTGTLTISHSRFLGNGAKGRSNALFFGQVLDNRGAATITDSAFDDNHVGVPIANDGTLRVLRTRFSSNVTQPELFEPGAIRNRGRLDIQDSTLDHNIGGAAGAIANAHGATATLINDTITHNAALRAAGGPSSLAPAGALSNSGVMMVRNTTIAFNALLYFNEWRYRSGGIVTTPNGYTALSSSIVSDNVATSPVTAHDCFGAYHSLGYNLIDNLNACFVGNKTTGNIYGKSARLLDLAANGGPTMTALPLQVSPVVDAGSPGAPSGDALSCAPNDQRGVARPRDGSGDGRARCDIGAAER